MPRKVLVLLALVALALGWFWSASRSEVGELRFLNVGQGDCILFRQAGRSVLVDTGPVNGERTAAERLVLPRLRELGVHGLDWIIVTHPDEDHVGGLATIWKKYPRAKVMANAAFRQHSVMLAAIYGADRKPEDVVWVRSSMRLEWASSKLGIYPPPDGSEGDNDGSLAVHVATQDSKAVLTGDLPMEGEEDLLPISDFESEVCLAGHHGSATSLSPAWLAEVRPKWVVASCGRENRYGHPTPESIERAETAGAKYLRTDRHGEVVFRAAPGGFQLVRPQG